MKSRRKWSEEQKIVAQNYGALTVLQALNYLLPFIIIPFLERSLGLEKFGLIMKAQYLMAFCLSITFFGFHITASREMSILKAAGKDYSSLFFKVFYARLILLITVFLLLSLLIFSIEKFRVEWEVYLLSYGVVIGQTLAGNWFFQGMEKMKLITIMNACAKLLFTFLLIVFISSPADYRYVPVFNSMGFIISGAIMFSVSLKYVNWQKPNLSGNKVFYVESFKVFVSDVATQFTFAANGLLLGFFAGDAVVGVFSAFDRLMLAAKKMYIPFYQAMYPYMSRKNGIEKRAMMANLIPIITIIGILGLLAIVVFGGWIVDFLFKDPEIYNNSNLLKWMGLIALFTGLSTLFTELYAPSKRLFDQRMRVMVVGSIFNLALGLSIVPLLGLEGTVITTISTEFVLLMAAYYFYRKDRSVVVSDSIKN